MKIESIIKRDPPTLVVLGDTAYQFQPDSEGRHVVEVTDNAHIARLLSIAEGYRIPGDGTVVAAPVPAPTPAPTPAPVAPTIQPVDEDVLKGSTVHPVTFEIKGEEISIEDVVAVAYDESGMTTAEWNAMPDEARHSLIDAILDAMAGDQEEGQEEGQAKPETPPAVVPPVADKQATETPAPVDDKAKYDAEREALAQTYKAKTGKLPHYKWSIEKITEELAKLSAEGA